VLAWMNNSLVFVCVSIGATLLIILYSIMVATLQMILKLIRTTEKIAQIKKIIYNTTAEQLYNIALFTIPIITALVLICVGNYLVYNAADSSFKYISGVAVVAFEMAVITFIAHKFSISYGNINDFLDK
jgi:hypothetical protein